MKQAKKMLALVCLFVFSLSITVYGIANGIPQVKNDKLAEKLFLDSLLPASERKYKTPEQVKTYIEMLKEKPDVLPTHEQVEGVYKFPFTPSAAT